jgi:hypothetical protein
MTQRTPEHEEFLRKLQTFVDAGIVGLNKVRWRPGMDVLDFVGPIVFQTIAHAGQELPLDELKAARSARCRSCDHLTELHQADGCCYTVAQGEPGRNLSCPCTVPRAAAGSS